MGQYYIIVNEDKKEFMVPFNFDTLLKLMEHSWIKNNFSDATTFLLSNKWKGDRVIHAGDYADPVFGSEDNLYQITDQEDSGYTEVTAVDVPWGFNSNEMIAVNIDKKEYMLMDHPKDEYGWQVNPLMLLIADGNGRGGGDYWSVNHEEVGRWVGDRIEVVPYDDMSELHEKGYTRLGFVFDDSERGRVVLG